jgi:hypothetical protein
MVTRSINFNFPDEMVEEMALALQPLVRGSVTPVAVYANETILPFASGTFFRIGTHHFLVTAAHVFNDAKDYGDKSGSLCVFDFDTKIDGGYQMKAVPLQGKKLLLEQPNEVDVGVMELWPVTVSNLKSRRFLTLSDVQMRPDLPGWGWVSGFPNEWAKPIEKNSIKYNPFNFGGLLPGQVPTGLANFDPTIHFALSAKRNTFESINGGTTESLQYFQGISGTSIWQSWWKNEDTETQWKSKKLKVVGVDTSHYRSEGLIRATTWRLVALIIMTQYPEHHVTFDLHFPGILCDHLKMGR